MAFMDEEIIAKRNEAREKNERNLSNEVIIDGVTYTFARQELLKDKLTVILPESFIDMDPTTAQVKYPSTQRPQIIKCSMDGKANFAFNMTDLPLTKEGAVTRSTEMRAAVKRTNPACVFSEKGTLEISDEMNAGFFEFKSYAFDADIYNLMFTANVGGQMILGTFNCVYDLWEDWKPLVLQMVQSIQMKKL